MLNAVDPAPHLNVAVPPALYRARLDLSNIFNSLFEPQVTQTSAHANSDLDDAGRHSFVIRHLNTPPYHSNDGRRLA